jgi:hypothetical protein
MHISCPDWSEGAFCNISLTMLSKVYKVDISYDVLHTLTIPTSTGTEAEFLDVIGTKFLRICLLAIHSHLYCRILLPLPPPLSKSGLKLVCN